MATKRQRTTRGLIKNLNEQIPQWKLDFLFTGEMPDPCHGFKRFAFTATPPISGCKTEVWSELWERIKDERFVKDWKKQHGLTYAEKLLKNR